VQKQSRRWGTIAVLGFSSLVFIGLSVLPLVGGIMSQKKETTAISTAKPNAVADSPEILKKEEEGYQLVLKRDPNNPTVLQGLLETRLKLIQQGVRQPKDVIEPLEKLVKLNPGQPLYPILLGQAQEKSGNGTAAAGTYRTVLDQQPTNTEALQRYVTLLLQQNQPAAAFDVLQKSSAAAKQVNQQQPNSADLPAIELLMGDVYLAQQKTGEAIALYDRLQKESPNDFRPVVAKGIVLKNQGKNTEALTLFKSAQALAPAQVKDKIQQLIASTQGGAATPANPFSSPSPTQSSAP
jgi:tetratricopeptide (TPR) repeat protein